MRNKKELKELRAMRARLKQSWPGPCVFKSIRVNDALYHSLRVARQLGQTIVAIERDSPEEGHVVQYHAIEL